MKKHLFLCIFAFASISAFGQGPGEKESTASIHYRAYRNQAVEPAYHLSKIKALIKKIKADDEGTARMSERLYSTLSTKERFTYTMIHGEDSSQNCDAMPPVMDSEKKIFGYIPDAFDESNYWSKRQQEFLHQNRGQVIQMLRDTLNAKHRAGINLKWAVFELNAKELFPDLAKLYRRDRKDHDILTVMMLVMKEKNYKPFLASSIYKKMYGNPETSYRDVMNATRASEDEIMKYGLGFAAGK
jgi:hypothetical protein